VGTAPSRCCCARAISSLGRLCATDAERLDVKNGLLLAALLDAALALRQFADHWGMPASVILG
jgi:hypothetical protein